jgi:hypothetical protein
MTDEPDQATTAGAAADSPAGQPSAPGPTAGGPAGPAPVPGAGTLAVLALAWLLAMLSSARLAVGDAPQATPLAMVRAALELPQVVAASLVSGAAVGLAALGLAARLAGSGPARPLSRYGLGAGTGLLAGVAVGTPIILAYRELPSILLLGGTVAGAAGLGGLVAGFRRRTVVAAGVTGALGGFVVGLVERIFEGDLRHVFGARDSAESVVTASAWLVLAGAVVAGVVAGAAGYAYLRRSRRDGPRWPAYLLAGAMPGLFMLLAEVVTRLGGARLFQLVGAAGPDDRSVLSYVAAARLDRALIMVFAGALAAVILFGRTIRPDHESRSQAG